jgi:UDP-N-acetylmuramyl pentapeptide phosphotransferase/UDP-N-acetylglucosamine-1-phosphate transferase
MNPAQKRKFLFGELPLFGGMGVVVAACFIFFAVLDGKPEMGFVFIGLLFAFGVFILGLFYLICWLDIRRSKRRYEAETF